MFDLLDRPLHWIPVKWPALVPAKKDSELSVAGEVEIELRVEIVDVDEAKKLFPELFGVKDAEGPDDFDIFKKVVREWRKIKSNGRAVPMTDDNIRLLLKTPCFASAFGRSYVAALAGQKEVRSGNSNASPSGGRGEAAKSATTTSSETATASD